MNFFSFLANQGDTSYLIVTAFVAISLVIAISCHEFAHAMTADLLGDPNPRLQGRITLNPLKHLDPLGTAAMIFVGFGWGKPVEFDPYNLRHPIRDAALIAATGPITNFVLAIIIALANYFFINFADYNQTNIIIQAFFSIFISINIGLMVFNLLPIPPLDGHHILAALLPTNTALKLKSIQRRLGPSLLLILILPLFGGRSLISIFVQPISQTIISLLNPL